MRARTCELIIVSEQQDNEAEELKRVNAELRESLAACRFMLADARKKLTANSNEKVVLRAKRRPAQTK